MNTHQCPCGRAINDRDTAQQGRGGCDCGRSCSMVTTNSDGSCRDCGDHPVVSPPWEWIDNISPGTWIATALAIAVGLSAGAMLAGLIVGGLAK